MICRKPLPPARTRLRKTKRTLVLHNCSRHSHSQLRLPEDRLQQSDKFSVALAPACDSWNYPRLQSLSLDCRGPRAAWLAEEVFTRRPATFTFPPNGQSGHRMASADRCPRSRPDPSVFFLFARREAPEFSRT